MMNNAAQSTVVTDSNKLVEAQASGQRSLKILYLTDGFPLSDMPGGSRYYQLARYLQSKGHHVTVLANARNYISDKIVFNGTVSHDGIRIIGLPTPKGRHLARWRRVAVYAALMMQAYRVGRTLERQDVVISGTPPLLMPIAGLFLARRFKARSVLEVRDLHPQMSIASGIVRNPLVIWLWRKIEEGLRHGFDHIVAAVPRMRSMIVAEGNSASKITVIQNGYDLDSDEEVNLPFELESFFRANSDKFIVAYTGNMGLGGWNLRGMVEAAEQIRHRRDIIFLFVGNGEQRLGCEEYVRQKNLASCYFFSAVGRLEIATVMRRCQALMMMARSDNAFNEYALPLKLYDYMGAGRAIVYCGRGDGPDLLEKAKAGIALRQFDAKAFAEAIVRLADDPMQALKLGENGRHYVESALLRKYQIVKWDDVIQDRVQAGEYGEAG